MTPSIALRNLSLAHSECSKELDTYGTVSAKTNRKFLKAEEDYRINVAPPKKY